MLTKPQIESDPMEDLKFDLKNMEEGIIIYTASTMEEQRAIAEYINTIDGGDYEILDFSQKEQHPSTKPLYATNSNKLIIANMQEIGIASYCESDNKTTITLQDKVGWFERQIDDISRRHEASSLLMINMLRDTFFRGKKVICGIHPRFLDKMEYMPYYVYIDDWLDYVVGKVRFNENPEFTQCLPIPKSSSNSAEVQACDMIFTFNGTVVRWPNFSISDHYTEDEYIEKLSQLPQISFLSTEQKDKER